MILYHVTHKANALSISNKGLSVSQATRLPYIWLCTRSVLVHFRGHVAQTHGWQVSDTVVFVLDVPRSQVTHYRRGVWRSAIDISPRKMTLYVPSSSSIMVRAGVLGLRLKLHKADNRRSGVQSPSRRSGRLPLRADE